MERVIKFRAWMKIWKEMIVLYGFLYVGKNSIQLFYVDADGCKSSCTVALEDIVLEQFTGLLDKNGKEIFEGDICKLVLNTVSVEYTSGSFKFKCVDKDVWFPLCEFTVNQLFPEIIGNIHEGGI